jgi:ubiquinone/menaquinone biosynthesis C-methylase UbiE
VRLGPDLRRRSTEPELLDDAHCHPDEVAKSLSDLRFVNRWLSARGRLLRAVAPYMPPGGRLLDVGCGSGDVAAFLQARLSPPRWKPGGPVRAVGVDLKPLHLRHAPHRLGRVAADVWRLPFRDASFDVVTASLFLHHFEDEKLARLLRELARLARRAIVVSDLERAWVPHAFARAVFPLVFETKLSVHDGLVSIRRGFRASELREAFQAAGLPVEIRRLFPYRLLAVAARS